MKNAVNLLDLYKILPTATDEMLPSGHKIVTQTDNIWTIKPGAVSLKWAKVCSLIIESQINNKKIFGTLPPIYFQHLKGE